MAMSLNKAQALLSNKSLTTQENLDWKRTADNELTVLARSQIIARRSNSVEHVNMFGKTKVRQNVAQH